MSKYGPLFTYECPFLKDCLAQIDENHYRTSCHELTETKKPPNFLSCNAYQQMQNTPRMWKKRLYGRAMDIGHSQARQTQRGQTRV